MLVVGDGDADVCLHEGVGVGGGGQHEGRFARIVRQLPLVGEVVQFAAINGFVFVFALDGGEAFRRLVDSFEVAFFDFCGVNVVGEYGAVVFVFHDGDDVVFRLVRHDPGTAFLLGKVDVGGFFGYGREVFQFFAQFVQVGQVLDAGVGVEVGEVFGLFFGVARGKCGVAGDGDK